MYADTPTPQEAEYAEDSPPQDPFLRREGLISDAEAIEHTRNIIDHLSTVSLPKTAIRVFMWLLSHTLNRQATTVIFGHETLSHTLGIDSKNVGRELKRLVAAGLIDYAHGDKGKYFSEATIKTMEVKDEEHQVITPPSPSKPADTQEQEQRSKDARRAASILSRARIPHGALRSQAGLQDDLLGLPTAYTRSYAAMVWTIGTWAGINDDLLLSTEQRKRYKDAGRNLPVERVSLADIPQWCEEHNHHIPDSFTHLRHGQQTDYKALLISAKTKAQAAAAVF